MEKQRIDKWLWHVRLVRTRVAAAELANQGHVRINGQRADAASRAVRAGDVVTVALDRGVRVMKVLAFAERRGSPGEAAALYERLDVAESPEGVSSPSPSREPGGGGRPTKRERRALDRFKAHWD
ncbi:MAG: RNA-binding S4 domain-containing protein [Variibacter sp.]